MPFPKRAKFSIWARRKIEKPNECPNKHVCGLCGSPTDSFHDTVRCGRTYQANLDREAMARKRGTA
jgi:hypothetical protein